MFAEFGPGKINIASMVTIVAYSIFSLFMFYAAFVKGDLFSWGLGFLVVFFGFIEFRRQAFQIDRIEIKNDKITCMHGGLRPKQFLIHNVKKIEFSRIPEEGLWDSVIVYTNSDKCSVSISRWKKEEKEKFLAYAKMFNWEIVDANSNKGAGSASVTPQEKNQERAMFFVFVGLGILMLLGLAFVLVPILF